MDENVKSNITLGNERTQEVAGKGTIVVKAKNGLTKCVQDIVCVPSLA